MNDKNRVSFLVKYSTLITMVLTGLTIVSQDNNYWNQMPGSRSALLGGAVVGGVRDNSAIFYNPGALSFIDSSSISITANSFQYETAKVINGGGTGVDYLSKQFQTIPLVSVSSTFKIKRFPKSTLGIMVFTKNQTSNVFSKRVDDSLSKDILGTYDECYYYSKNPKIGYIGDFNMRTGLNETWIGFGYSHKLNKYFSLGLTPFVAYRTQYYSKSFVSRVMLDKYSNYAQGQVTSEGYSDISNIASSSIRLLGKFGLSIDLGNLKIGSSFTSSSYNLGGKALISRDITYNGGLADPYSSIQPFFGPPKDTVIYAYMYNLNDKQEVIKTTFKSPASLALGLEYRLKNTTFAFSGEYFWKVDPYNFITPDSNNFYRSGNIAPSASSPTTINSAKSNKYLKIIEANRAVFNYGFAIEQSLSSTVISYLNSIKLKNLNLEGITICLSYRTDKTSFKKNSNDFWVYKYGYGDTTYTVGQRMSFSENDIHHLNFGLTFQRQKSDLHIGFLYSYGTNNQFEALNNISDPKDNVISNNLGAVPNFSNNAEYVYKSYSILLGYTYHLK
ncbi:MAG: hypothetical protein K0R26_1956 [Bacteroidota bacterium]|jgi:hypothetical protein|nr:hypothetical protein [Bacteroidota bacterium]